MKTWILIIALGLLHFSTHAQKKNEIIMYACQFVAGASDGVNQALVHHYLGMGNKFWDFQTSWKNKYRDYDKGDYRPAFFGAKSFAVAFTDGYHLTRMIDRSFTTASLAFCICGKNDWKSIVRKLIISTAVNRAGFLLTYDVMFPRTPD